MTLFACHSWEPCCACGQTAEFLCDRRDEWGKTCDETMCEVHRFPRRGGGDYCPACAGRTTQQHGELYADAFGVIRGKEEA